MIRGKDFVKITAEGAGRISSEQAGSKNEQLKSGRNIVASIDNMFPYYNIAGVTNLWIVETFKYVYTRWSVMHYWNVFRKYETNNKEYFTHL